MERVKRGAALLPILQITVAVLWLPAAMIPGSIWRVPDLVFDLLFPAVFAALAAVGLVTIRRSRERRPAVTLGTSLCGILLAFSVGIALVGYYVSRDLADF